VSATTHNSQQKTEQRFEPKIFYGSDGKEKGILEQNQAIEKRNNLL